MKSGKLKIIALIAQANCIASKFSRANSKKSRRPKHYIRHKPFLKDWWASSWGQLVRNPNVANMETYEGKLFRFRFRLPFKLFTFLVDACKAHRVFGSETTASGSDALPVELKVLGALRTLGRATLHDDVAEMSGADKETHRKAFLIFIRFVADKLAEEWIQVPAGEELDQVVKEYTLMGFPGAVGSMDATHIHWMHCPAGANNLHTGKEGFPTRVFNVAVTHSGKIFSVTPGQPGARNDKTIVRFDALMNNMRFNGLFKDLTFKLCDQNGATTTYQGGYLISDNGYHHWKEFVCPVKVSADPEIVRWSRWLESVRKDVECCFGRLKARFTCLRNPIMLKRETDIDALFITCCILHNMLLAWDGLDVAYEDPTTWRGQDDDDLVDDEPSNNVFSRVARRAQAALDLSFVAPVQVIISIGCKLQKLQVF
jgi:hypothetical protein